MSELIHFVYITTNTVNGKKYIGDHSSETLDDDYLGSGLLIIKAIKKCKKENFNRQILEQFNTKEAAFKSQEKYIKQYNTLVPNGYNISPKGGVGITRCHSSETKQKMKEKAKIRIRYPQSEESKEKNRKSHLGKRHSIETCEKQSKSLKGKTAYIHTVEINQKISKSLKGKKRGPYKKLTKF